VSTSRRSFLVAGIAGITGLAGAALAGRAMAASADPAKDPDARVDPPVFGDENAHKRLVVWGSYTCPYTAMLIPTLERIVSDLAGAVCLEWRHFPTHEPDPALHVLGLAFEGKHFWGFTNNVLATVLAAGGNFSGLTPPFLAALAKSEGGSIEMLNAALADLAKWKAVRQDLLAGKLLGINFTPGLFYNGYFLTPDGIPQDLDAFDKSLRAMLQS